MRETSRSEITSAKLELTVQPPLFYIWIFWHPRRGEKWIFPPLLKSEKILLCWVHDFSQTYWPWPKNETEKPREQLSTTSWSEQRKTILWHAYAQYITTHIRNWWNKIGIILWSDACRIMVAFSSDCSASLPRSPDNLVPELIFYFSCDDWWHENIQYIVAKKKIKSENIPSKSSL